MRHVAGVGLQRVESRFQPRSVERGHHVAARDERLGGSSQMDLIVALDLVQKLLALLLGHKQLHPRLVPWQTEAPAQRASNRRDSFDARKKRNREEAHQPHADRDDRKEAEQRPQSFDPPPAAAGWVEEYCSVGHGLSEGAMIQNRRNPTPLPT